MVSSLPKQPTDYTEHTDVPSMNRALQPIEPNKPTDNLDAMAGRMFKKLF